MNIVLKDVTGESRPDSDIEQALDAIRKEIVTNPLARFKDGFPTTIHYIVIVDALEELIMLRSAIRKEKTSK